MDSIVISSESRIVVFRKRSVKCHTPTALHRTLTLVQHEKPEVRRDACSILKIVATAKSLSALQKASSDSDALTARFAKEAVKTAKGEQ